MKVLQMSSELDGGGVERILFNYYSYMDHEKVHFDFLKVESKEGILEQPLREMGCKIFSVPPMRENYKGYKKRIEKILVEGKYDAIHCNGGYRSFFALQIAKKLGVPVRIAHAHTSYPPENFKQRLERFIATILTKHYATKLLACGEQAAEWMWGEKDYHSGKVQIVHNAILTDLYRYDESRRNALRKKFGIENKFVIGNIGRMSYAKNHRFMLEVLTEVIKQRTNALLVLIGCGELEDEVKKYAADLGLLEQVKFLGVRDDVPDLLNMLDLFILPSLFEGLPVTAVEVQANGLPALISDRVTKEIKINDNVEYLPLQKSIWVRRLLQNNFVREDRGIEHITKFGYAIEKEAKKLEEIY